MFFILFISTVDKLAHSSNAPSPIFVTFSGMIMDSMAVFLKADFPIVVSLEPSAIVTFFRLFTLSKAQLPISVTLAGIVTSAFSANPADANIYAGIVVIPSENSNVLMLQLENSILSEAN